MARKYRPKPRRQASSKPFMQTGMGKIVGLFVIGILALSFYKIGTGEWNFNFDGADTIIPSTPSTPATASEGYLWTFADKSHMQAPDINITIQDVRFYSGDPATNPTSDGMYVYVSTDNWLLTDAEGTENSYFDRLQNHITAGDYMKGTSPVSYASACTEIISSSTLTGLVRNPTDYGETDGLLYITLFDTGYVSGTVSSSEPDGLPVVFQIDLREIPGYSDNLSTPPTHFITLGTTMSGVKQVWPADAGGASIAWGTITGGWPEVGSVTLTDTNSTANNTVTWDVAFASGGIYYYDPKGVGEGGQGAVETIFRVRANSTTMTYNKVEIENEEVSYVEVPSGGYTELYFICPREWAVGGKAPDVKITYGTTEASTYLKIYPFMGEWSTFSQQAISSSLGKVFELASEDSDDGHCT